MTMPRGSWPQLLLIQVLIACVSVSQARAPWNIGGASNSVPPKAAALQWGRYRGGSQVSQDSSTSTTASIEGQVLQPPTPTHPPPPQDSNDNDNNATANTDNSQQNQTTVSDTVMEIPDWKQQLPPPLCFKSSKTLKRICVPYQDHVAEIYLLGTAHVSNDSSRDVKLLLETLHPQVIFVELCDQRTALMEDPPEILQNLTHHNNNSTDKKKVPFFQKVQELQLNTNNSKLQCMATVLLTSTQEEYADSLGVELGGEFRVAYQYWRSFPNNGNKKQPSQRTRPHLILGDRPLAITLARCWESLSFFGKLKVLIGLLISSFHKPTPEELRAWIQKIMDDESDLLSSSLEELRRHFPSLERVIIQERDAYMACKLYQLCRGMLVSAVQQQQQQQEQQQWSNTDSNDNDDSTKRIVIAALVGAGHVPGICAWLTTKNHPEGPEAILDKLIATKKYAHADLSPLVYDVTELQDKPPEQ